MELLLLCLKIFFVRILDVSLGTVRTILTTKGKTILSSCIGFIEVLIWFLVVKDALNTDIDSILIAISYAGGFATGTFIGGFIAKKFIHGNSSIQIITKNKKIIDVISGNGYGVTEIDAKGYNDQKKYMLIVEVQNKNVDDIKRIVKKLDQNAFIVVTETKLVHNGFIK